MDTSPIAIAREKGHQDIVELLSDWTLGASSPPTVPGPTSPEVQKSPHGHLPTPPRSTTSPSNVEIRPKVNNIAPKITQHHQPPTTNVGTMAHDRRRVNGDLCKTQGKRKRKACGKTVQQQQQPIRAKMNGYPFHPYQQMNGYVQHGNFPDISKHESPVMSPPYGEGPPPAIQRLPITQGRMYVDFSREAPREHLPELTDADIIEGIMFAAEGCLEELPQSWGEGTTGVIRAQQIAMTNPLSAHSTMPNTSIGPPGVTLPYPDQNTGSRPRTVFIGDQFQRKGKLVTAGSMPTLSHNNFNIGPRIIREDDFQSDAMMDHQMTRLSYGNEMLQPPVLSHQFPTPPSAHSGHSISSPGNSVSPANAAASFLTPSPDTLSNNSPAEWSSSPHSSNSESSVC